MVRRRSIDRNRILRVLLLSALVASVAVGQAAASPLDGFRYRPADCALDAEDKMYVRFVSGFHFAFPVEHLRNVARFSDLQIDLSANAEQPRGCPDNPVEIDTITISWPPDWDGPAPDPNWRNLKLIVTQTDGPVYLHQSYAKNVERLAGNFTPLSPQLEIFRGAVTREGYSPTDGTATIVPKPGMYPLSRGLRVVVRCQPAINPGGGKNCRQVYSLTEGLSVNYQFSSRYVAEADVLKLDRHVRRYLARYQLSQQECEALGICGERRWEPAISLEPPE